MSLSPTSVSCRRTSTGIYCGKWLRAKNLNSGDFQVWWRETNKTKNIQIISSQKYKHFVAVTGILWRILKGSNQQTCQITFCSEMTRDGLSSPENIINKEITSVLWAIINTKVRAFPDGYIFLKQQLNNISSFAPENNCAFDSYLHEWCQIFHIFSWLTKVANLPDALFLPRYEPHVLTFSEKIVNEIMHVVSARWLSGPFKVTYQFLPDPTL